ncbi:MAG: putative manganese-dependent inorganic diphosphatase [Bacillota bacterium]|nr:putative manganese-dependent inorganic diphosphatase [Bacillota bacterium]
MSIFVIGHKNPDTDSITAAITYSNLKRKLGYDTVPYRLGEVNLETEYVLDFFNVDEIKYIENVKIQLSDLKYNMIKPLTPNVSVQYTYNYMNQNKVRTQPIVDESNRLIGIVTMRDIAMSLISGDYYKINTSLLNIQSDLNADIINKGEELVSGEMLLVAYHYKTVKKHKLINEMSIVIVGDRYDVIKLCLERKVKLIIITGGAQLPEELLALCRNSEVSVVITPFDSYTTAKYMNQVNFVSLIMIKEVIKFNSNDYLDYFKEEIQNHSHSKYPIVEKNGKYLGMVSRRHILNPGKKKVVLVDHNEYRQSVEGLKQSEIIEIVDHHKLGDISTELPITFRNCPVGSTNTIIYQMYKESDIEIDEKNAGLMLSGLISDTLFLKSPTTTLIDRMVFDELKEIVKIDVGEFATNMFKKGTTLVGQSTESIFNRDFKEFRLYGEKVGIAQVFTLDVKEVFDRKEEFAQYIHRIFTQRNHSLTLLLITDIIKEGSYLLYESKNNQLLSVALGIKINQGDYVDKLVSRKKQVLPKIMEAITILK